MNVVRPPTITMVKVIVANMTVTFVGVFAAGVFRAAPEIASVPEKLAFTQMTVLFVAVFDTRNLICAPRRPFTPIYNDPMVTLTAVWEPA